MEFLVDPGNYEDSKSKLNSAAIVGHTTANESKIWVRVYTPGAWWLVVSEKPLEGNLYTLDAMEVDDYFHRKGVNLVFKQAQDIKEANGLMHTFLVSGLRANTKYYYAVIAGVGMKVERRTEIGMKGNYWFKTMKADPSAITFGFYSCHDPYSRKDHGEGMWPHLFQTLTEKKADFAIGGGDQIYIDTNSTKDIQDIWEWLKDNKDLLIKHYSDANGDLMVMEIEEYLTKLYRVYYRIYWNQVNLKKVFSRFPQYMIWDDHEIMDGWGSLTWKERTAQIARLFKKDVHEKDKELVEIMFKAASNAYDEYQHSHNPTTTDVPDADGVPVRDYGFMHGNFAFYVMDMRGHHDFETGNHDDFSQLAYRLLGKDQHDRISQWLHKPETVAAKALFIVSPVPMVHWNETMTSVLDHGEAKDDLRDEWGHESNHAERESLLRSLFSFSDANNCPVIFMSGDVHSASAFKLHSDGHTDARVFSVTSSGISRKPAPGIAAVAIQKGGRLPGDGVRCEQLYSFTGQNNFACFSASIEDDELQVVVDLFWPGGDDMEIVHKKIRLV